LSLRPSLRVATGEVCEARRSDLGEASSSSSVTVVGSYLVPRRDPEGLKFHGCLRAIHPGGNRSAVDALDDAIATVCDPRATGRRKSGSGNARKELVTPNFHQLEPGCAVVGHARHLPSRRLTAVKSSQTVEAPCISERSAD